MTQDTVQVWLFTIGSVILISASIISMIVHRITDDYSIKYDRLSYTGIRNDFTHPIRGTEYSKSSYPEILNYSLVMSGLLYFLAFLRIDELSLKIIGSTFSVLVIVIGAVDVSTLYHVHNGAVILSQPVFFTFMIYQLVIEYNQINLITLISVIILVIINVTQKQRQNRKPELRVNVVPQKLFIFIEAFYFAIFPTLI